MPNYITIDGTQYGMSSTAAAASIFNRALDAMRRAEEDGEPKPLGWASDLGEDPVYTVVVLTSSSAVSMVVDRDAGDEVSATIGESIADAQERYTERIRREMAEEEGEEPTP